MTSEFAARPDSAAEPARARKFSVSDAMLLTAGAALAIWGGSKLVVNMADQCIEFCRTIMAYDSALYLAHPEFWRQRLEVHWSTALWYGFQVIDVLLLSMTPALLLVRLRRPRPPIRRLLRQPGAVATLAVTFGYFWVFGWMDRLRHGRLSLPCGIAVAVGGTVAIAWALLALSRQWHSEPSWIDRMGRLVGAAAIGVGLFAFTKFGI
jgi:hypothetical protein